MTMRQILGTLIAASAVCLAGCEPAGDPESKGPAAEAESHTAVEPDQGQAAGPAEAAGETQPSEEQPSDIVDTAVAAGDFGTLAAALKAADLVETLKSSGPFTVFAPTDEAFAKLPEGTVESLLMPENKDQLVSVLTYHVVPGKVDSSAVAGLTSAKTVNGAEVSIDAGTGGVKIDGANVTTADIICSNGVIHVIDAVILPPSSEKAAAKTEHAGEPLAIEGVGSFKTLFAAIEAAGLKDTLENNGPFTIFAPTDEAFAALPEGTVDSLLKPENKDQLVAVLTYHVVAGEVPSSKVGELTSAKTVNGAELPIKVADGAVHIGDAKVVKTDVPCEVGLIHAIDKVLIP